MANESFKVLEIFDGVEYVFNCNTCGSRHMSTKGEFVEILEFKGH